MELLHFDFISLLYWLDVINNNLVVFLYFNVSVFPVTDYLILPVKYPIT